MSNRLINERSPYLRLHADDPVDWYPWSAEAFDKAKREDKPVFLSIGYSTCHWCHVMAAESFADKDIAAVLNRYFVSVKVDREERPDIDSVYMSACTALNGSGGWPLTVVMTPEQLPFYVGTYIPKHNRNGQPGLAELLRVLAVKWEQNRQGLLRVAVGITAALSRDALPVGNGDKLPERAAEQLLSAYDKEYGGFGTAPKFPSAPALLFLIEQTQLGGDRALRQAAEHTLQQMARGGIYDHFGGGFCRYSTDREWLAPHFEKTLYDNALLALCYTEAWRDGHFALYRTVAEDTLDYCLRELKAPEGGFVCGQDADSGGTEGAYYLFTPDEVKSVLGEDRGRHFCECYDITDEGNFHGKSIPNLLLNERWRLLPEGYSEFAERLRLYREERMELFTDMKLLSGWNGLMLMALSRAAWVFGDRRYLAEARELADFIASRFTENGRLMARLCGGELRYPATLEDCALCALGFLELYGADFDPENIKRAITMAREICEHFSDSTGGFYKTADDAERLIVRPKELYDGAMPSGGSAVLRLFDRLFRLTGDIRWRDEADRQADYISRTVGEHPAGCAYAMTALTLRERETKEIVCVLPDSHRPEQLRAISARRTPDMTLLVKAPDSAAALAALAPFTADMRVTDGKPTYYICSGGKCGLPVTY